ncbi:MAG: DUF2085 domain-containing protein [Acidobacteriota bacterium]|nr:DUF2085 domain-containing protein [Acidobacteriota bacterium]
MLDRRSIAIRFALPLVPLALVALAISAPLLATSPLLNISIRNFFSIVCHQDAARSFWIAGAPMAVCVRCLGVYLGAVVGAVVPLRRAVALRLVAAAVGFNALDVAAEAFGRHGNLPAMRFGFGLALGAAVGALVAAWVADSAALKLRRSASLPL